MVRLHYAARNKGTIQLVVTKGDLPKLQRIGKIFEKERQMSAAAAVLVVIGLALVTTTWYCHAKIA